MKVPDHLKEKIASLYKEITDNDSPLEFGFLKGIEYQKGEHSKLVHPMENDNKLLKEAVDLLKCTLNIKDKDLTRNRADVEILSEALEKIAFGTLEMNLNEILNKTEAQIAQEALAKLKKEEK